MLTHYSIVIRLLLVFSLFLNISCKSAVSAKTNSRYNKTYKQNIKAFAGKLNPADYIALKGAIEKELGITIPAEKGILINYSQRADNCMIAGLTKDYVLKVIDNKIRISSALCKAVNAEGFFVFSEDAFHKDLYGSNIVFKEDSGFFHTNVFTLHDVCEAFLALKPDGSFMKYYGEDYFTKVQFFFQTKNG